MDELTREHVETIRHDAQCAGFWPIKIHAPWLIALCDMALRYLDMDSASSQSVSEGTAKLVSELDALHQKATPGPWVASLQREEREGEPSIWSVHSPDDSYEATLCELWSGEHDNEACARFIAALRNAWPTLRDALPASASGRHPRL